MEAYYYKIQNKITKEVVIEGIIRESEDNIYPGRSGIEELPIECEAHHFRNKDYELIGW